MSTTARVKLTRSQQAAVERARALTVLRVNDWEAIATHIGAARPDDASAVYAEAWACAHVPIHQLVDIDGLTRGQS